MSLTRPQVRLDLTIVELDGEAVVYDEETTDLHHLNPTATVVLGLCDGGSTLKEISMDISEAFGAPIEEVEPQVRRLIRRFRKVRLLLPSGGSATQEGRRSPRRRKGTSVYP
jgi:PqqD family protein of HPr-rel-A system